jgi:hypothetical protein
MFKESDMHQKHGRLSSDCSLQNWHFLHQRFNVFCPSISGSSLAIFLQRLQTKLRPSRANTIAVPPDHLVWRSVQFGWGCVSIEAMCHGSDMLWLFKTWFLFWVQSFVGLQSGRVESKLDSRLLLPDLADSSILKFSNTKSYKVSKLHINVIHIWYVH